MPGAASYRARRRPTRSAETRRRIVDAVRALLDEGSFHDSTVEAVADRAGVSRATVYQHFRSRLDLVDAMCETFDENPALIEIRKVVELPDAEEALAQTIAHTVRFWASEDSVLRELYGVAAIDPAAQDLVNRQRADRRGEMTRLVKHLEKSGRLRPAATRRRALALLMLLTSYESFRELREAGVADREIETTLVDSARSLLLHSS